MNFEEEKFDSIIRQKAEGVNFPFDERNWEKAAAMLDAERKLAKGSSKINYIVSVVVVTVIVLSASVFVMLNDNTSTKSAFAAAQNNKAMKQEKGLKKEFENQSASLVPQYNNEIVESKAEQANAGEHFEFVAKGNNASHENKTVSNEENNVSENNEIAKKETPQQVFETEQTEETEIYVLSPVAAEFPELTQEKEITNLPFTALQRYDEDYYKRNAKRKTHYLNVEFGGVYLLGWKTKSGTDGQGADWYGGFNYGLYLCKRINVSVGLQTYNIRNINQAFYTRKQTEYDFGAVTSNTVVTSNNLYYLSIPLKLNYALNSNNQIAFGANSGFVVGAKNTVQTYKMTDGNTMSSSSTTKNNALYDGVNSFNLMLTASYKTQIIKRLFLSGEFIYGVTDIFKNNKDIKNQEQPMGIRVGLQYHLFDK